MMKRDIVTIVRLNQDEYKLVCKKADQDQETRYKSGKRNLGGYIRKCTLKESGYQPQPQLEKELKELAYQIRKIGVNINQATKKINAGYGEWKAAEELKEGIEQIDQRFQKFMERLEEIEEKISGDGDYKIDEY